MSHHAQHNWTGWDYERVTNVAGEVEVVAVRRCTWPKCGAVDYGRGDIIELGERVNYARHQQVNEEPDS